MVKFTKEQLEEFKFAFANIDGLDWSGLYSDPEDGSKDVPYNGRYAEPLLRKHIGELTAANIKTILDSRWDYLFQNGVPHISWETERHYLMASYISQRCKEYNSISYRETWSMVTEVWYRMPDSKSMIHAIERVPSTFSMGSRTTREYSVVEIDECPVPASHMIVTFNYDSYGSNPRIADSFKGTEDECMRYAIENKVDPLYFKIIDLREVRARMENVVLDE